MEREEFLACLERAKAAMDAQRDAVAETEEDPDLAYYMQDAELAAQVAREMGISLEEE